MADQKSDQSSDKRTTISPTIGLVNRQIFTTGPRWAVIGIFFILLFGALYLTASLVLPVVIALLFALVMSPIVRFMRRRLKVWEPISAFVLVVGTTTVLVSGFYMLSDPIAQIVSDAPRYARAVDRELESLRARIARLEQAQETVEETTEETIETESSDEPERVVIEEPGLLSSATTLAPQLLASIAFALIFLYFLLASGDLFYQKLVHAMPTLSDKKRALHIAHDIERELSRYLLTITVINSSLGIAVGTALWWTGMPNAAVFGALAALLNYIPYIGSLAGMALVGVIALAEFGELYAALIPVLLYFACTSVEGQLITPTVVGRRLEMNAAAVFLSVAFWGWIWGIAGMFLAVPVMVTIKVFSAYIEPMETLGNFLSADIKVPPDEE